MSGSSSLTPPFSVGSGQDESESGQNRERQTFDPPLLSVLNVVVDQIMVPPTPLEPEEFKVANESLPQKNTPSNVRVPVLRIFGPIIRRDRGIIASPRQSACVYIHGAFPYLLARPILAGPDGSIHHSSHLRSSGLDSISHVDWDSVEHVERIVPELHASLETTLQSSVQQSDESKVPLPPFIRRIIVVVGRGFYTYSPGPPAPFLRVEYYNPRHRWRVKMMLERGLEMPLRYQPDPQQYCATLTPPMDSEMGMEALTFNCYEAHIPYTMQFFKDYNLSGMSYIHVSDGRFRPRLPTQLRQQKLRPPESGTTFLQCNTPEEYLWPTKEDTSTRPEQSQATDKPCLRATKLSSLIDPLGFPLSSPNAIRSGLKIEYGDVTDRSWIERQTSCDLEIDTTVDQILNVRDIMTSLPSLEEERLSIHWRAVPSLREIWAQERRRMAKLLKPQDDFITQMTQDQKPPFTLNARKGNSTSGARLATLGMRRLFETSHGLSCEFERCMKQIVQRHSKSIGKVDRLLLEQCNGEAGSGTPSQVPSEGSVDSAVEALGALGSQFGEFGEEHAVEDSMIPLSPSILTEHESYRSNWLPRKGKSTQESDLLSQECRTQDPFLFSQRVDRCDSALEVEFLDVEECIDPTTLTPYDDIESGGYMDEECEMSEGEVEQTLSFLATQLTSTENMMDSGEKLASVEEEALVLQDDSIQSDSSQSLHASRLSTVTTEERLRTREGTPVRQLAQYHVGMSADPSRPTFISALATIESPPAARSLTSNDTHRKWRLQLEQCRGRVPTWLYHTARYDRYRSCLTNAPETANTANLTVNGGRVPVEPVQGPPSRWHVARWSQRQRRRRECVDPQQFKKPRSDKPEEQIKSTAVGLEIDGDSRTLVTVPHMQKRRLRQIAFGGTTSNSSVELIKGIEEAQPGQGQQSQLSSLSPWGNETEMEMIDQEIPVSLPRESMSDAADKSLLATSESTATDDPHIQGCALQGIGQQGGKIYVEGGGGLKARTRASQSVTGTELSSIEMPSPMTMMNIEIHVQCRSGRVGIDDRKEIAMKPDFKKDKVNAVVYVLACDPGGGDSIEIVESGCLFILNEAETVVGSRSGFSDSTQDHDKRISAALLAEVTFAPVIVESIRDEKKLLLRLSSIVRLKDPDMVLSWDTQSAGLGYIIERGSELGIDMARLLGRVPRTNKEEDDNKGPGVGAAFLGVENRTTNTNDGIDLTKHQRTSWVGSGLGSEWDERVGAGVAASSIDGRLVFAVWKIVGEEVKHPNASYLPAMVSTVLNKRIPYHDDITLSRWYACSDGRERWRTLYHRLRQAEACILLFNALDIVGRAGEAARLSGVPFAQSFPGIRGSQYKVEGVLLRALQSLGSDERGAKRGRQNISLTGVDRELAIDPGSCSFSSGSKSQSQSPFKVRRKPKTEFAEQSGTLEARQYFFFSPSNQDCSRQEALEVQALTLEPISGFQRDPVVVCDFTALYPSLVIAYNLCYSTCAGKLEYQSSRAELRVEGRTTGKLGPFQYPETRTATVLKHHMRSLYSREAPGDHQTRDRVYAAPTGSIFVSECVLKGVLPQVLDEILRTRAMLKRAAKEYKKHVVGLSPAVLRQLEARQLALKYVANVTYGYTSATFSGRSAMPILADTIVECGRRTLSNAIHLAKSWGREANGIWSGAEVIYGDTDSIFVKLPGRSVPEAFDFGEAFCKAVTASNPPPVQLKLEKVYHGSMMQTKKKYCGMKYESIRQKKPDFEAKGIETIRKDQCALTQKVLRNALITVFQNGIDSVKPYLERQWYLIRSGRLPVSDFILTGRVRSRYRGNGVGPVQAVLARRLAEADPGRIIRHKERLSYVIVATPGRNFRLRDCVLTPMELLERWDAFTIHSAYYITKHVNAALQRCFGLAPFNIDVNAWYDNCQKPRLRVHFWPVTRSGSTAMISSFFGSDICSLCDKKCGAQGNARAVVCDSCQHDRTKAVHQSLTRLRMTQEKAHAVARECSTCNLCFEDATTFGAEKPVSLEKHGKMRSNAGIITPIANCTSIDCSNTFERSLLRDAELEAVAVAKALGVWSIDSIVEKMS